MNKNTIFKFYLVYKLYIFPGVIALSSLILIMLIILPQTQKLLTNQKAQKEIAKKEQLLETKVQALESLDVGNLDSKVNAALNSFPIDKDFANVLGILQNITSQSGFSIISLSLGSGSAENEKIQSYSVKLDLVGPSGLLKTLLTNIETSPRLMRISSMETSSVADSNSVSLSLSLDILYSSGPTGFGSVDSPLPELSKQDEEVLAELTKVGFEKGVQTPSQLSPRGKPNPFE